MWMNLLNETELGNNKFIGQATSKWIQDDVMGFAEVTDNNSI